MAIFNSYVTNYQRVNLGDGLSLGLMNLVLFSPQDWLKKPAEVRVFQPPGLCEGRMSNVLANINTHTLRDAPQMVVEEGKKSGRLVKYVLKKMVNQWFIIWNQWFITLTVVIWWERYANLLQLLWGPPGNRHHWGCWEEGRAEAGSTSRGQCSKLLKPLLVDDYSQSIWEFKPLTYGDSSKAWKTPKSSGM